MKKSREGDIQRAVRSYAEKKGWLTYKWSSANTRGVPDCIFVNPSGKIVFIEFKSAKGKLSRLQQVCIKKLAANNVTVLVVNNVDLGKFIVDMYG